MSSIHYCIIRIREFYTHYRHSLVFPTKQSPCSFSTYFCFSILTLYILWEKWISIEYLVKNGHTAKWYKVNFMHFEVRATWVSRSVIFSTSIYMHTLSGRWRAMKNIMTTKTFTNSISYNWVVRRNYWMTELHSSIKYKKQPHCINIFFLPSHQLIFHLKGNVIV